MPITARLSRTLHDALGNEAAADLVDWMQQVDTHRAELRELNELNYARFDSRMNELRDVTAARLGEFRHELRADISGLRGEMRASIAGLRDETHTSIAALREETLGGIAGLREETRGSIGEVREETRAVRDEMRAGFAELKIALAGVESKIDRRFADLVKWSFLFWCGAVAAAALARGPR